MPRHEATMTGRMPGRHRRPDEPHPVARSHPAQGDDRVRVSRRLPTLAPRPRHPPMTPNDRRSTKRRPARRRSDIRRPTPPHLDLRGGEPPPHDRRDGATPHESTSRHRDQRRETPDRNERSPHPPLRPTPAHECREGRRNPLSRWVRAEMQPRRSRPAENELASSIRAGDPSTPSKHVSPHPTVLV